MSGFGTDFDPKAFSANMNKIAQDMFKTMSSIPGVGNNLQGFADQLTGEKEKFRFTVNGKDGEIAVLKSGVIIIGVENQTEDDVKEIVRKLIHQ